MPNISGQHAGGSRRRFLRAMGCGTAFFAVPGLFAEVLTLTPRQTEGPFYPDRMPLDTDNDLITRSDGADRRDAHFQGFGRFLTGSAGEYYFRTIKPKPYPGRTPHIHFAIKLPGQDKWTTQCYVKGEPQNERDGVLRGIRDPKARESVLIDFVSVPGSPADELSARFDIVMGYTPGA
jgi:protocatechuate 3,4-dioxygenase, beta subunit